MIIAINFGVTGPTLRGSGVDYDLRKTEPYSIYDKFDFNVPVGEGLMGTVGDCWDRYYVRILEVKESVKILRQAIKSIPSKKEDDLINVIFPKKVKPRKGEIYSRYESSASCY